MDAIYQANTLSEGRTPAGWMETVVPRSREVFHQQRERCLQILEQGAFLDEATFFAADDRGPVGLVVGTGSEDTWRVEFLAVRGDRRRRGLGKALLERAIEAGRSRGIRRLTISGVSTRNGPAMRLFESAGFVGEKQGGLRMWRSLDDDPLPPLEVPDGFTLRALRPGEEAEWVRMKTEAFHEEGMREWTVEDFQKQFAAHPVFEYERVFVALHGERIVATATAWEADYGGGPAGLIHWVGTEPEYRGRGLGMSVTIRALEDLAARGYAQAVLNTGKERVAAVKLYEKLGFKLYREILVYTLPLSGG